MKQFNLIIVLLVFCTSMVVAQDRYLAEVFASVNVDEDVKYAENISVLTGAPDTVDLVMDVYTPAGDDATDRPLFLYFHTGSFLPQYVNNQITGGKRDSSVVEICKQLARRGYVAASISYRSGWNPVAQDQDERTSTLLKAAYRGIHDMKAAVRYFRMTVDQMENPYGINPDKIGLWGQGTGGYIAFGAFLDDITEIQIAKFVDSRTNEFYVNENLDGNVDGTNQTPLNIPNNPEYPSNVQFVVEMGGAMGDIGWVNGKEGEPAVMGFHVTTDPFAPYADGAVIVPVTNQFVVNVSGPRTVVQRANDLGINAVFEQANMEDTPLNDKVAEYKNLIFEDTVTLATDGVFPFVPASKIIPASGPWEWWNADQLAAEINFLNTNLGTNFNAATLNATGLLTNPDMSKEKALRYIDTMMTYTAPRAFYALNLTTSLEEIVDEAQVELEMYPNPATDYVVFRTDEDMPMKDIAVYNMEGKLLRVVMDINNHAYEFQRKNLAPGMYVVKLRFEDGILSKKLVIRD
jgi:hypothetical protein